MKSKQYTQIHTYKLNKLTDLSQLQYYLKKKTKEEEQLYILS